MTIRAAINGYGRIGRSVLRALYESNGADSANVRYADSIKIVAINEVADCNTIAHLTRYDSTHGRFPGKVELGRDELIVNGDTIRVLHEESLEKLPWSELGVDLVFECSGAFSDRATAELHLSSGAKKVLFSQPADADVDATVVFGINEGQLTGEETVVSNASCSTNCVVPVINVLDRVFGIEAGVITTIHSAMNDQPVLDAYHHTDLRKTRAAFQSIIPVDTGLARGIARLLPALDGKFEAQAMRVPTLNVSAIDLSVWLKTSTTTAQLNRELEKAANGELAGILGYTTEPLASCDFNHDPRSGVVDASQTRLSQNRLAKVLIWFDNEWGYANRMLDVASVWLSAQEKQTQEI